MQDHKAFILGRKSEAMQKELITSDLFPFYEKIFEYQALYYKDFLMEDCLSPVSINSASPIINASTLTFNAFAKRILLKSLNELTGLIRQYNEGLDFSLFLASVTDREGLIDQSARTLLSLNADAMKQLALDHRMGLEEFLFFLVNWMKPVFVSQQERMADSVAVDDWQNETCPLCGFYSDIAMIVGGKEGKRYLHCALCECQWLYKRVACAVCGNEKHNTIGYFEIEDDKLHRIDYCEVCKGYIKTLVIDKFKEPSDYDLVVENLFTPHLDSTAIESGYMRP